MAELQRNIIEFVQINNIVFKPCKFKETVAYDMFGVTTLDKCGWTDETHEHLIDGNNFENIIVRKEYDNYNVYEE